MKITFNNHDELDAFIRLLQEIVLALESELMVTTDSYERYEISAKIELIEELYPKVARKQFNAQKKNSVNITKAVAIIIFQNRDIAIDIYAEMLKNRIVQDIHKEMV